MRRDFHMHPRIVQRPEWIEEFVRVAVSKNIKEICVTDHMPLSVSKASDRIPHGMVGEYCRRVRELAKRYEDVISIRLGIEVDYHPESLGEIDAVLSAGEFDYILASSHVHVFLKKFEKYTFNDFAAVALENSIRAAEDGRFDIITHPDQFRWVFGLPTRFPLVDDGYAPERHRDLWEQLFDTVLKKEMRLELNPHLAESKGDVSYAYPQDTVAAWALERGVRFSYGSDAHVPESVGAFLDGLETHPTYGIALREWENV